MALRCFLRRRRHQLHLLPPHLQLLAKAPPRLHRLLLLLFHPKTPPFLLYFGLLFLMQIAFAFVLKTDEQ